MSILIFLAGAFVASMYYKKRVKSLESDISVLEDKLRKQSLENYKNVSQGIDKLFNENLN